MLIVVMNRIGWFWKPIWIDGGERVSVVDLVVFVRATIGADGYASTHASTGTAGGVREVCDDSFAPTTPRAATCRTLLDLATTFVRVLKIWIEGLMVKRSFCFCFNSLRAIFRLACCLDRFVIQESKKFCENDIFGCSLCKQPFLDILVVAVNTSTNATITSNYLLNFSYRVNIRNDGSVSFPLRDLSWIHSLFTDRKTITMTELFKLLSWSGSQFLLQSQTNSRSLASTWSLLFREARLHVPLFMFLSLTD